MTKPREEPGSRLLVRDLAQVATPRGSAAPLRGADLGALDVLEGAYVLCEGSRIVEVGEMRLLRALANPWLDILGHPVGRILLSRAGIDLDLEAVLDAAAVHGVALEVNGDPNRLDLDWRWHRAATGRGIRLAIDPDAHGPETIEPLLAGALAIARKGWVTAKQALNALPVEEFRAALRRNR